MLLFSLKFLHDKCLRTGEDEELWFRQKSHEHGRRKKGLIKIDVTAGAESLHREKFAADSKSFILITKTHFD